MNRITRATAAIALATFGLCTVAQAQDVTLRMGLGSSKPHPFVTAGELFAANVDELSKGAMKIELFPDRQLGDVKELNEGVRFGTIDLTINSSGASADKIPAIDALQLPFIVGSYEEFAKAVTSPEGIALYDGIDDSGAIALTIFEGGRRHFLSVNKPVATMEDFKGLKTRVAPVRLHLDIWNAVGVNPTPMAYGEVYTGLETHTIDAVETNISSMESEKYKEIAKYALKTGHYMWPALLLMNKARFDGLTPEQQKVLKDAAVATVMPQILALQEYDDDLQKQLTEKDGMVFTEMTPELQAELVAATRPVTEAYARKEPKIQAFIDAIAKMRKM
jgi:tripartite ATP-independent transporter DctP family solute receptor